MKLATYFVLNNLDVQVNQISRCRFELSGVAVDGSVSCHQHPHVDPSAGLPNEANEGVEISLAVEYVRA
jgi:hypothetical protein